MPEASPIGGAWEAFATPTGDVGQRRGYILKLHGTRGDRSTWVFTRGQYDKAMFGRPELRGTFEALFRTYPILFVGCGLDDDDLDQTFAAVRALSGAQPPMHFAIVAAPVAPFRRRMLQAAGLRLITYENGDGEHAEVSELIRALGAPAGRGASKAPDADDGKVLRFDIRPTRSHLLEPDFLDRIERVCRLRKPDATVTRLASPPPFGAHLRVETVEGEIVEARIVAGVEHGLDDDTLDRFLALVLAGYRGDAAVLGFELVYGSPPATPELVKRAGRQRVVVKSFAQYQGLVDLRSYVAKQTAKLAADAIYPPSLYVTQRAVVTVGRADRPATDALDAALELLDTPHPCFVLVLADFGTGKTFLLHELARRLGEQHDGMLVPVLIEMRALEKARSRREAGGAGGTGDVGADGGLFRGAGGAGGGGGVGGEGAGRRGGGGRGEECAAGAAKAWRSGTARGRPGG